jgi:hypothetical protein
MTHNDAGAVYRKLAAFLGIYLVLSIAVPAIMMLRTAQATGAAGVTAETQHQARLPQAPATVGALRSK